jgi:DNA-binding NarL/FixJ family response regulator
MLVDDHPVVREGVAAVLNLDSDCEVVGSAGSVKDAMASMDRIQPDVITIDVRLPDMDGIDACEMIRMQHPQVRILVLTRFANERVMMRAFRGGAHGFLVKESDPVVLRQAVRVVGAGGTFVDPRLADKLVLAATRGRRAPGPYGLTPQELRVVGLLPRGLSNQEIGLELGISTETVKTHLRNAMRKLQVDDRAAAAAFATREGLG